ncbi:hypothetical protein JB92DRAFT_3092483 [Gautieria morchelliformis]|nr:hypothetical protein JB92DRAFT_3092483 [Gautieria morchelliformis]
MSESPGTSASLTWMCPQRAFGLRPLPLETYEEIFSWLRPIKMDPIFIQTYHQHLRWLAHVCRFFAYYAAHEICRSLDFKGVEYCSTSWKPTGSWCRGIIKRFHSTDTMRTAVKECRIHDWAGRSQNLTVYRAASTLSKFLSGFDKLDQITLYQVPVSYILLQAIGKLPSLQKLEIASCYLDLVTSCPKAPMFGKKDTPFPVLRHLIIESTHPKTNPALEEAMRVLARVTTLRSLALTDSDWLHFFLPYISQDIISLSGNFSAIPMDMFRQFIKTHAALRDLTIHFQTHESYRCLSEKHETYVWRPQRLLSYAAFHVDGTDLPDLRSFSGPFDLATKFIGDRPVTRLALGSHLRTHKYVPCIFGLTVFPHTNSAMDVDPPDYSSHMDDNRFIWNRLEIMGGGIRELFFPINPTAITATLLSSCFPNIVKLEFQLRMWDTLADGPTSFDYLPKLEEILRGFKSLECLTLTGRMHYPFSFWVSPGDQHDFIHLVARPTLRTIVIGPWMAWHVRAHPMGIRACSCELEILSPTELCTELRFLAWTRQSRRPTWQLRDWYGKVAGAFSEELLGMDEDVQTLFDFSR